MAQQGAQPGGTPLLSVKGICKSFSLNAVLKGIDLSVGAGEVLALIGGNGAGKSTLMKIIMGIYQQDEGDIYIKGEKLNLSRPSVALAAGIYMVPQEPMLFPNMSVEENILIGFSEKPAELRRRLVQQMDEIGWHLDLHRKASSLSIAEQQLVEILRGLLRNAQVLILDEPTSALTFKEVESLFKCVNDLREKGIGIIYISHFLNEVVQIADRITVIRDGAVVRTYTNENRDTPITTITQDMVGRPVDMFYDKEKCPIGDVMLEVKDLQLRKDSPKVSFTVRKGEIVGFSGMVGSGRTELVRALVGADSRFGGRIFINGKEVQIHNPNDSINAGVAFITEDRQKLGLMLHASVLENSTILGLREKIKGFFVNVKKFPPLVEPLLKNLRVKTPSVWTEAVYLSGGNQQKVVLAKWLFAEQDIYIFDEPTRGIDVNAKAEFYKQMSELTKQGKCILMISSDMPELISMSDRVLVVRDGAIDCELTGQDINEQEIIKRALGVKKNGR